jgi:flagellar basal-body rod modification protein FlgD
MSTVNPVTNPTGPGLTGSATAAGALGKDDFLKMLAAQVQRQDPMNPSTDQDFIGTMAQFAMLEQVTNLTKSNEKMQKTLADDHAFGLIGKTVAYNDADGQRVEGVVEKVSIDGDKTTLTVAGKPGIDPAKVTEVR